MTINELIAYRINNIDSLAGNDSIIFNKSFIISIIIMFVFLAIGVILALCFESMGLGLFIVMVIIGCTLGTVYQGHYTKIFNEKLAEFEKTNVSEYIAGLAPTEYKLKDINREGDTNIYNVTYYDASNILNTQTIAVKKVITDTKENKIQVKVLDKDVTKKYKRGFYDAVVFYNPSLNKE